MIRAYDSGKWMQPAAPLNKALPGVNAYQPHVFSDGHGSVWVAAKPHMNAPGGNANRGYWEYYVTHLDGERLEQSRDHSRQPRTFQHAHQRALSPRTATYGWRGRPTVARSSSPIARFARKSLQVRLPIRKAPHPHSGP